jgi:hypothetical protein
MPRHAVNADAVLRLVEYESRPLRLRQGTADQTADTREIIAHSRVLIAAPDALVARGRLSNGRAMAPLRSDPTGSPVPRQHPEYR